MKRIVLDEFHITVYVSAKLPEKECLRIRRTLRGNRFRRELDRAVRQVLLRYSSLRQAKMAISQ
jgi:hypothetical protein